ncbi:MAG: hypothetical protein ACLPJH_08290 [Myxococcaceae bacterium]
MSPVATATSLSALVRAQGIISERALVDAAAGEPLRGSWWGHPAGHAIFRALEGLREDADVFLCKLLDGKQTYVHRRLWPALLRLQAEPSLWPALSLGGRQLLLRAEREGAVQATGRLRLELETSLRVVARSEHTPSGAHAVVLTPFRSHFSAADCAAAGRLTLAQAQAALAPALRALPSKRRRLRGRPSRRPVGRKRSAAGPKSPGGSVRTARPRRGPAGGRPPSR